MFSQFALADPGEGGARMCMHPISNLREGDVFTHVCLFTGGGVGQTSLEADPP